MYLDTHNRLILVGFTLAYFCGMSALAALSFEVYGPLATKFVFLPGALVGTVLIAIAKLSPVRG